MPLTTLHRICGFLNRLVRLMFCQLGTSGQRLHGHSFRPKSGRPAFELGALSRRQVLTLSGGWMPAPRSWTTACSTSCCPRLPMKTWRAGCAISWMCRAWNKGHSKHFGPRGRPGQTGPGHVWRRYRFESAWLPNVPLGHKCGRLHGHGFEVILHANQDAGGRDISIDYDHLDEVWAPFHYQLNRKYLNDIDGLSSPDQ